MGKRKFFGLGRKPKPKKTKKKVFKLPDNFIIGLTDQKNFKPVAKDPEKINEDTD